MTSTVRTISDGSVCCSVGLAFSRFARVSKKLASKENAVEDSEEIRSSHFVTKRKSNSVTPDGTKIRKFSDASCSLTRRADPNISNRFSKSIA